MGKRTGRPVGRPPKFTSKEQIQELGEAYLRECMGKPFIMDDGSVLRDKYGEVILLGRHPPTVTGLARALGFTSRQSLLEYQAKAEFADTVTRLKMQIEEYAEILKLIGFNVNVSETHWGDFYQFSAKNADDYEISLLYSLGYGHLMIYK